MTWWTTPFACCALWSLALLGAGGCTVEASIGSHDLGPDAAGGQEGAGSANDASTDAARGALDAGPEAGAGDGEVLREGGAVDADDDETELPEDDGDASDIDPAEPDASDDHESSPEAEVAAWCAERATDSDCTECEIAHCCEALFDCFEQEACACRVECRDADLPEDCAAECPPPGLDETPLSSCDAEACAAECD